VHFEFKPPLFKKVESFSFYSSTTMKNILPKHDAPTKKAPLLPLVPDPLDEITSETSISYILSTVPADTNSATFKKYVRVLSGSKTVRTMLCWAQDTTQVLVGLNINAGPAQYNIHINMIQGTVGLGNTKNLTK
jgi:hypothetical protein